MLIEMKLSGMKGNKEKLKFEKQGEPTGAIYRTLPLRPLRRNSKYTLGQVMHMPKSFVHSILLLWFISNSSKFEEGVRKVATVLTF